MQQRSLATLAWAWAWSCALLISACGGGEDTPAAPTALPAGAFKVHLARRNLTLQVPPEQTIVRAIELAGLRVPTSCLSGLCGSCKVDYLEGSVEHHDYILSDAEQQRSLTLCVSRARGTLVLDL